MSYPLINIYSQKEEKTTTNLDYILIWGNTKDAPILEPTSIVQLDTPDDRVERPQYNTDLLPLRFLRLPRAGLWPKTDQNQCP